MARNTAEVDSVTLVVDGSEVGALAPEAEVARDLPPSTYRVQVNGPQGGIIVPAADVPVPEGTATIMYLIGSRPDESLIWIGQSITGLQAPPVAVPTGNSGLAAPADGAPWSTPVVAGLALLLGLAALSGTVEVRRGRRPA